MDVTSQDLHFFVSSKSNVSSLKQAKLSSAESSVMETDGSPMSYVQETKRDRTGLRCHNNATLRSLGSLECMEVILFL